MKVTIKTDEGKAILTSGVESCGVCLDLCIKAMIAVGFHADHVRDAVVEMGEELDT